MGKLLKNFMAKTIKQLAWKLNKFSGYCYYVKSWETNNNVHLSGTFWT